MKKQRIFFKALAVMLSVIIISAAIPFTVFAETESILSEADESDFTYNFVTQDTIEITSYSGYECNVTVPKTIDGFTVVGIANFHKAPESMKINTKLKKVILPDTVTYIGDNAFEHERDGFNTDYSKLIEIVLPEGLLTIGNYAFSDCRELKKIDIPSTVTNIGEGAFQHCNSMKEINFRGKNTTLTGDSFGTAKWSTLASALDKEYQNWLYQDNNSDFFIWQGWLLGYKGESKTPVIPKGVVGIGSSVFHYNTEITAVTLPDGLKYIGENAFYGCTGLTKVDIPAGVERIESSAFADCENIASVTFRKGLKYIGESAFDDCKALTSVSLPNGLKEIGDCAFSYCENIQQFSFPKSLEKITQSAVQDTKWFQSIPSETEIYCGSVFLGIAGLYVDYPSKLVIRPGTLNVYIEYYCEGLNELVLPDGLKSLTIKEGYYCNITTLDIPESVEYINCNKLESLTTVNFPQEAKIESNSFSSCPKLKNITVPRGNPYLNAFGGSNEIESITLPDDVLKVEQIGGPKLKYVNLGKIRVLGEHALSRCSNLKSINLPNTLVSIGDFAFNECTGLESITLPDSLTSIGLGAMNGCSSLKSVKGGKNVKTLGDYCFTDCTSLNSFGSLPQGVQLVYHGTFANTAWYNNQPDGQVYFGSIAYCYKGDMKSNSVLTIKSGTVSVAEGYIFGSVDLNWRDMADFSQPNLVGLVLPKSCKYVGRESFSKCPNLKSVDLGGTEYVGDSAFNNTACETITLPSTMRHIGQHAFASRKLKNAYLNVGLRAIEEGAFFSMGDIKSITIPESVTFIDSYSIGYYPPDPDDPLTPSATIPDFVIYGVGGTEAERYANQNGIKFCGSKTLINSMIVIGNGYGNWLNGAYWNTYYEENYMEKISDTVYQITFKNVEQNDDCQFKLVANGLLNDTWGGVVASPGKTETAVYNSDDNITFSVDYELADVTLTVDLTDFDSVKKTGVKFRIDVVDKTPPLKVYGDVNGDGEVTIEDATIIQKEIVGFVYFDYNQYILADVDNDGEVTVFDVTLIQKYLAGGYSDTGLVGELSDIR